MMDGRVGLTVLLVLSIVQTVKDDPEPEVIGFPQPIKVGVGGDVILPCHLEPPFDVTTLTVEWRVNKSMVHVYRHGRDDPRPQDDRFKGRTSLFHEEMAHGNISLKLSRVELLDAGHYICVVPKLHSLQVKQGYVDLTVDPDGTGGQNNMTGDPGGAGGQRNGTAGGDTLSVGACVGIGCAVVVGLALLVIAVYGIYRCLSNRRREQWMRVPAIFRANNVQVQRAAGQQAGAGNGEEVVENNGGGGGEPEVP